MWHPDVKNRRGALYRVIADALADDVASGRLEPGMRLPTHRALAELLEVTVGTVTRAYAEAERRGLVDATVGRGTFVRPSAPATGTAEARFPDMHPGTPVGSYRDHVVQEDGASPEAGGGLGEVVDLSANYPVPAHVGAALNQGLQGLAGAARLADVGGYQPANGRAEHRAAGARWLARTGLEADPEDVIVVPGAQGGQSIAFQALCRPGDTVLVEALTWPGVKATARAQGLRLVPVAMDAQGLRPDALDEACARTGARVVYCMPTLHNPSNVTMDEARRRDILKVAAKREILVVEDDVYGFLHAGRHVPLAQLDRERVVHVTSLSKSLAPGLRVGYVVPPHRLMSRVAAAIRASMLMTCPLAAEWASVLIAEGGATAAAEAQRGEAVARQRISARHLDGLPVRADAHSFHLWLELPAPWQTSDFAARALSRGVVVTPGDAFTVDVDPNAVRLCLCAVPDRGLLERSLRALAALMTARPESALPVV